MLARMVDVEFQSGRVDEASRIVLDQILPVMQEQGGSEVSRSSLRRTQAKRYP